jgi:hypothetical protein
VTIGSQRAGFARRRRAVSVGRHRGSRCKLSGPLARTERVYFPYMQTASISHRKYMPGLHRFCGAFTDKRGRGAQMGSERSGAASEDLQFIPAVLAEHCRRLIESYHAIHGYRSLPDFLWRAQVRDFVERHDGLRDLFRTASTTRSARAASSAYVAIASTLLALEILAGNFLDWASKFPGAKEAASLRLAHLSARRVCLKDVYLSRRGEFRRETNSTEPASGTEVAGAHPGVNSESSQLGGAAKSETASTSDTPGVL